jgi:molybdopterin/thiamine biosynthesis adenylyltransferase
MWYIENYKRHKREREALELLASTENWLTPIQWRIDESLRLIWDADILTPAGNRPVSLRYPNHFPYSPPLVLPRGDRTRWSGHQYGPGGELCLEYGPDNWHQDITGADMIASAHRLLEGEEPAPGVAAEVSSRHKTTLGQDLRSVFGRLLLTHALDEELRAFPEGVMAVARTAVMYHPNDCAARVIASITLPNGRIWEDEAPDIETLGFEQPVALFRWPSSLPFPATASLTEFRQAVLQEGLALPDVPYAVVVHGDNTRAFYLNVEGDTLSESALIPPQPLASRLDNDHMALRERKVAMVGCGSLGSKVAVTLARSGVTHFLLVDDDLFLPDNIVRHDLDWREVGAHKANGIARRINLINPAAKCIVRRYRLGGQESSGAIEDLIDTLAECDLMIDATAEPEVFNYLCAAVAVSKKPMMWAEVFGGGFGGLIARHRPGKEPDPASMRLAIENWCCDQGKPMPRPAHRYGGVPRVPGIADDADVSVIAAHAARMAIDLLIPRDPSVFPHSVYLVGLAEGWIFDQPFETRPIDVGAPALTESDKAEAEDEDEKKAEYERIGKLFSEFADAAAPGATGE